MKPIYFAHPNNLNRKYIFTRANPCAPTASGLSLGKVNGGIFMKSIWHSTQLLSPYPSLPGSIRTEAAVIGGGLAGILTAYYLTRSGIQTTILEARRIGSGQTSGTTAKITAQHNLIYQKLITCFGEGDARMYASANQHAIKEYSRLIHSHSIDCDFREASACLYTRLAGDSLQQEYKAASWLGIPAKLSTDTELPFSVRNALYFPHQAQFHPLKFLKAITKGLTIYENTPVLSVKGHQIHTSLGDVTARHIIFACHYPFLLWPGLYFARMYQSRSYCLSLAGIPSLQDMYLGIDPGGLSFRSAGNRLLLGGCSHRTGIIPDNPYQRLQNFVHKYYPTAKTVSHWSAQDCMPLDQVPYIGPFSFLEPDWYVITGFGKWGMTTSMVAAQLISRKICKKPVPWESVFTPRRIKLKASWKEAINHLSESSRGLALGLIHPDRRCSHMGCRLKWNPHECTWECPCHGSRFSHQGKLLSGPAQTSVSIPSK